MASPPLVSVVVPCLNRAAYLGPTIDSVLRQTYANTECVVVDGGSTDGTLGLLERYGPRIRWVSEPDEGHSDAINKGWQLSHGEILAWLNADDLYATPRAVEDAMSYLQAHEQVDVVYGDYQKIDEQGRPSSGIIRPQEWDLARAALDCHCIIPQPTSFIRRRAVERVHGLRNLNGKDFDLWLRIGVGGAISYRPGVLALVRECPGLTQQGDTMARALVEIAERFLSQPNLPEQFGQEAFRRRSLSNAHARGGSYALQYGGRLGLALASWRQAIRLDPTNCPGVVSLILRTLYHSAAPTRLRRRLSVLHPGIH